VSQLLYLQEKIRTNAAALARLEAELPRFQNSGGLLSNILTLRRQQESLQSAFSSAADQLGLDVVHYKLLDDSPSARAFARAIGGFQDALAMTYEALRFGPKSRRVISAETEADTDLRFAYSYPGSTAVVFTIANERFLLSDWFSNLDRAAEAVIDLGKAADNTATITRSAKLLGRASVVSIYNWAKANTQNNLGAVVEWKRDKNTTRSALIQAPEFAALSSTLERTGERKEEDLTPSGVLVGADTKTRRFHFVSDDDEDIRGKFTDAISDSQQAQLPSRYRAILHKTIETSYATEDEKASFFLARLEPPKP
jgi:hypothetical protein